MNSVEVAVMPCAMSRTVLFQYPSSQTIKLPPDTRQALCLFYAEPLSPILAQRVQRARLTELTRVVITTTVHRSEHHACEQH
jgi:hypothetical protein